MQSSTTKALRGNDTALPILGQQNVQTGTAELWERHLSKTYGLPSSFATIYAAILELEARP
ncbi:MAG: hypothetical protein O9286_08460 [Aquidulcibacter sp.]|jgi:hypothetical protein|uniref:hypothetical protein n=1 Tax=Aquidulcibacter sp. TaxID=2052990 RepID=UPI0022CB441D|nr:hypothetical protein [Aquidulcibacter sp.]